MILRTRTRYGIAEQKRANASPGEGILRRLTILSPPFFIRFRREARVLSTCEALRSQSLTLPSRVRALLQSAPSATPNDILESPFRRRGRCTTFINTLRLSAILRGSLIDCLIFIGELSERLIISTDDLIVQVLGGRRLCGAEN
jgi:hypothetical protein